VQIRCGPGKDVLENLQTTPEGEGDREEAAGSNALRLLGCSSARCVGQHLTAEPDRRRLREVEVGKSVGKPALPDARVHGELSLAMRASLWKPTEHVHFCFLENSTLSA
jgi:hypothetical protein